MAASERRVYVQRHPEQGMTVRDVVMAGLLKGIPILGKGYYKPPTEYVDFVTGEGKFTATYSFCAQVTEVEVDRETGQVKPVETSLAHDCGFAINPMDIEGQIDGGVAMSQGLALSEEIIWDNGQVLNPSFLEYKLPLPLNVPKVKPIIVESIDPEGPFGAKEAGESTGHIGPAAIGNAIYDAVGVRVKDLPITPDKILQALNEKEGRKR